MNICHVKQMFAKDLLMHLHIHILLSTYILYCKSLLKEESQWRSG